MATAMIPLFPLNVVLFPDSAIPLHIFEERYKILISGCLEGTGNEFGINLVNNGSLSPVGCSAVVREVIRRYDDGRMDIVVEGKRRYELVRIDQSSAPYFIGEVNFFEEEPEIIDGALAGQVGDLYNRLVDVAYGGTIPRVRSAGAHALSYTVVQKSGLDLQERQQLLEMKSENARLERLRAYLSAVVPRLEQAHVVRRIISNDGYIINT